MSRILLVEDDLSLIDGLSYSLKKQSFEVDIARTVKEAHNLFCDEIHALLILDLSLPDGSGFEVCKKIRQYSTVPIIFLTAADEEVNIVMGLDLGGDDYITKPFKMGELMSRINALLRRAKAFQASDVEILSNGLKVLPLKGQVYKDEASLDLTAVEYKLLCMLMRNPNSVLSKEAIMENLWDSHENYVDGNTLAVYIRRLRMKIEHDPNRPQMLLTVRGMGYKWKV